jgi:hypothetical protein
LVRGSTSNHNTGQKGGVSKNAAFPSSLIPYFSSPQFRIFPGGFIVKENSRLSNHRKSILAAARLLCAMAVALAFPLVSFAQLYTGSITGLVTDPSGAAIPGAKVTLFDENKGFVFTASTDSAGRYVLRSIPPGTYKISVEAVNFRGQQQEHVKLDVTQNISIDFSLKVGAASASVEVKANAVQLQTEDAVTGQVVDRKFINDLPLVDRDFVGLAFLAPGVTTTNIVPNQGTAINFNSNGSRNSTADVLIDGASATNFDQNSGIQALVYQPSVDAVEEFKVQQSNFTAEYGFAAGAIINVVTRSGSNQIHGSAYEFWRNQILDANNWFNNATNTPISPFRRNNFGGTVGGPIKKDKTFFFFDYEGLRERASSGNNGFFGVPTHAKEGIQPLSIVAVVLAEPVWEISANCARCKADTSIRMACAWIPIMRLSLKVRSSTPTPVNLTRTRAGQFAPRFPTIIWQLIRVREIQRRGPSFLQVRAT